MLFSRPSAPPAVSYVSTANDSTNATTWTFTAQPISPGFVVVAVTSRIGGNVPSFAFSGVTIGGAAASLLVAKNHYNVTSASTTAIEIWGLTVTSGTTADIVPTVTGGTGVRCGIAVFAATGVSTTPYSTLAADAGASTTVVTGGLNTVANSVVIAAATGVAGSGTCTWTNLTERLDTVLESTQCWTAASDSGVAAATPLTLTATFTSTTARPAMVAVCLKAP